MNQENLPMELKQNQLAVQKRKNQRIIDGAKRIGKVGLNLGVALSGAAVAAIGGPIVSTIGFGTYVISSVAAGKNILYKRVNKNSMFLQKKNLKGEIRLSQDATNLKTLQKMKGFTPAEKGSMMGMELLVALQNIKQQYEDRGIPTEQAKDGENGIYPQVYTTTTHGINIKTVEALEKLGYIQIEKKEPTHKSGLFFEKLGFGQYKQAMETLGTMFSPEERKKHQKQMYEMAIKITDKPLNFEELYQDYLQCKETKGIDLTRKPLKRIGLVLEALKERNIDIQKNKIGETEINYNANQSFAQRIEMEQRDPCEDFRESMEVDESQMLDIEKENGNLTPEKQVFKAKAEPDGR